MSRTCATRPRCWFQFVPSRGGQLNSQKVSCGEFCFNSCPHAEGNLNPTWVEWLMGVSIRALTRRATAD